MEFEHFIKNFENLEEKEKSLFNKDFETYKELKKLKEELKQLNIYIDFDLSCEIHTLYKIYN